MSRNTNIRPLRSLAWRRNAALLCAALAGFGLAAGRAAAQATGPLPTSPPTPTPFQSPLYHSGGAATPYDGTAADAPYITPLIDPIQGQLQGTPTELYNGNLTQIPSYLLGDYDPTRPPTGLTVGGPDAGVNIYYPNHFADGGIYAWAAPFNYVSLTASTVTVDDNAGLPTAGVSGFTSTGFTAVTDSVAFPAAGTATNGEYLRLLVGNGTNGSAVWTLYQPTAGNYSVYFHIPNDLPSGAATPIPEPRSTQVLYFITVRDAGGNVTTTTSATSSQTEANSSQFLAGPFQVAAGGTVTVTLSQTAGVNFFPGDYLVADSMMLQQTIGDVQSAPTAITHDLYPGDFESTAHPLQYWGIYVPAGANVVSASPATSVQAVSNAIPDTTTATSADTLTTINNGNILLKTGNPTKGLNQGGTVDGLRAIRQLVYFGRSDPAASISNSVDDSAGPPKFTNNGGGLTISAPNLSAATASNGEYVRYGTTPGAIPTAFSPAAATWTVPTPSGSANVFVYAHIPANLTGELRLSRVYYTVTVNGVTGSPVSISQITQGTDALVALPTGPLAPVAGSPVVVKMYSVNTTGAAGTPVVVADSITVSTGSGQGAIYCVDGFTGGVVWRFETPGSANGSSAPVFASPAIARINVLVTPAVGGTPAVYANRLVVIVGDNDGLVYCLDAIGNGDGTSNVNVLAKDTAGNPIPGEPVTIPQPAYGTAVAPLVAGTAAATAAATAHVGTTGVYWIYRPDANQPKYVTGPNVGKVKPIDPTTDLPVPAAFNTASPNVFVDPTISTTTPVKANAIVYIGNSNGVLYALNASGGARDGSSVDDPLNVSQNLGTAFAGVPSAQPLWWFTLRGPDPNSGSNASSADIESAPAIYVKNVTTAGVVSYVPTVYIGSAHEMETTSNVGRVYALNGLYGPAFDNGRFSAVPGVPNYAPPGAFNYNVGQRPQLSPYDTSDWSFPDAVGRDNYAIGKSTSGHPRPALGNITGSPVVFTNLDENAANKNADNSPRQTRIYFAADSGQEYPAPARPDDTQTGRLWAVNLDGSVGTTTNSGTTGATWAYPLANDPNKAALDKVAEPYSPIGSFLRGTPAIGFVQFPLTTTNGDGTAYNPSDAVHTGGISSASVPMLYVGTRGVNDTALYAVNIDGDMTAATDQRTIYRVVSPDGSIYQSSPALVTNATSAGGNGGGVYAVAGNTLYDYSATPISNPLPGAYPIIRENKAFVGFGPISSPALAGANVSDFVSAQNFLTSGTGATGQFNNSGYTTLTTDWLYVGDSSTGLCRGITPNDSSYGGIPTELGSIIPPSVNAPGTHVLSSPIQTFLVPTQTSASLGDAELVGANTNLAVFEWGQSVFARFSNVAPPNPTTDPNLFVYDTRLYSAADLAAATSTNYIPFYTSDGTTAQTVSFNVADANTTTSSQGRPGALTVQPRIITTPPDGFVIAAGALPASFTDAAVVTNLVANNGNRYLGTYTYTIEDGTALPDTPGARRRFQDVQQIVTEWDYQGGPINLITSYKRSDSPQVLNGDATGTGLVSEKHVDPITKAVTYGFDKNSVIPPVDQPTFGILNPLAVRGGGVNLLTGAQAVPVGDGLGPFRGEPTTLSNPATIFDVQALANGNTFSTFVPPSSSGVAGNNTVLATGTAGTASDPTGINAPMVTNVVVTATGLITDNTTGDNTANEPGNPVYPNGVFSGSNNGTDGLTVGATGTPFGGYTLDVFDRSDLFDLGQTLRVKLGVPDTNAPFGPPASRDGIYWNSNVVNDTTNPPHAAVVNFLPWEVPPTPYPIGGTANGSQDYPDIAPGNITVNARAVVTGAGVTLNSPGDLTSNNITLPPGQRGTASGSITSDQNRTVIGNPVQVQINVPNHQPANQQLYQEPNLLTNQSYNLTGQIAPVDLTGASQINTSDAVVPMGYVTTKRLYVPNQYGNYDPSRPYRVVRIYTGVPVDMRTSFDQGSLTTDIGPVPAAFGLQSENDPNYGLFTPYTPAFQHFFKPEFIHNDGNVNLLNAHFDQKLTSGLGNQTLVLHSDAVDLLSTISGFDLPPTGSTYGETGPRHGTIGTSVPEQAYLIRSSLDSDLLATYDRNPNVSAAIYPGVTFHKPIVGSNQPSTLNVPDSPEQYVPGYSLNPSVDSLPKPPTVTDPNNNNLPYSAPPYVSFAVPFGTPVGTYTTNPADDPASLRLFEGLDTTTADSYSPNLPDISNPANYAATHNYLYPPKYGAAVGGIGNPSFDGTTGEPNDSSGVEDVYNGKQPISTQGTQLTGTVVEQRLTDGSTSGAVPMIDAGPAVSNGANPPVFTSTPDFAPAAFRDPATGNLSVYWTSGRAGANAYSIYGANLPFTFDPSSTDPKHGYFVPNNPPQPSANPTVGWWLPFMPTLAPGTNSGLSIAPGTGTTNYGFDVAVVTTPYNNTLYSYSVNPASGVLSNPQAITSDPSQVKYGVRGLDTSFTNPLWAFWTASTRGRTAINYSSQTSGGAWQAATSLLPIPAGLTAVADPSPMLMTAPVNGTGATTIEVTYSGTAPDGNVDLYVSRYVPDGTTTATAPKLDLIPFPPVTENLRSVGGWYQSRDVAWSRTGALNVSVTYTDANGKLQTLPSLLYNAANVPQFTKAIYDKASGLLVLTGVQVPTIVNGAVSSHTTNTVYVDAATGRIRFSPALLPATQNFAPIRATFSPLARRLTEDSRADSGPVTFLDTAPKANDSANLPGIPETDRRWTIWRKSGVSTTIGSASLYYKTQRLTAYLPNSVDTTKTITITLNGASYTGAVDVDNVPAVNNDFVPGQPITVKYPASARLYFPIVSGAEGATFTVSYTDLAGNARTAPATAPDTVQWQDEIQATDQNALPFTNSIDALDNINPGYGVPIVTATNENNVAAFLDPFASATSPHKVWAVLEQHPQWHSGHLFRNDQPALRTGTVRLRS